MSYLVETPIGRFRAISSEGHPGWLLECPGCRTWAHLNADQWNGRASINHAADGCKGGYHETHDFAAALRAAEPAATGIPA